MSQKQIGLMALVISLVFGTAALGEMGAGQKIGIDLGPTATDNWNNITENGTLAAGSVVAIDGATLAGVSITVADGRFFNNDGADDWGGLSANGGSAPEEFVDSVTTDIAGTYGAGQPPFQIAIAGLNDTLTYDIVAVCTSIPPYANEETVTINDTVSLTVARDDARDNGVFHSFTGVATDGAGNLVLIFTNDPQENPIVCGVLITAMAMGQASGPQPETEAEDVLRDATLSWTPGLYAAAHDVYLGTSFDDVNDASRAADRGVLVSQGQAAASYTPEAVLDFGQTYYWRIDEVNAAPDNTTFKGEVWNFTVEPLAYPIETVVATSNGTPQGAANPDNIVNGAGLNENDEHSVESADMWLATPVGDEPLTIEFAFDRVYKLHEMLIWNYNVQVEPLLGFGIQDVTIEYSVDDVDWTALGDATLDQATGQMDYVANSAIDFGGVAAKFVKLTVNSSFGTIGQFGLSEVRFLFIPVQPREPQPEDSAADVAPDADLSWRAGREAVSHEVYLSTDPDALELIDTTSVATVEPGDLELGATYYWKVDEVNEAEAISTWEGAVWSFATQAFLIIDDFESYTDDIEAGEAIFQTWIDGYEINDNGSLVGHIEAPFAETMIVKSGGQSMPLFYDNTSAAVSEAELSLAQDWTTSGIKSLSLFFRGAVDNTGQLYVKVNGVKVVYDGDSTDIARTVWQPWNIDLSAVGGSLSSVTSLVVGVEGAGVSGVVYIDDIRLYPKAPELATPVAPDAAGLVAHYTLDGNANDSSANGYDGVAEGDVTYRDGVAGSGANFDGIDSLINCGDVPVGQAGTISVAFWVNPRNINQDWAGYVSKWTLDDAERTFWIGQHATDGWLCFSIYPGGPTAETATDSGQVILTDGEWTHIVCTYDGNIQKIYADGVETVASAPRDAALVDRGGDLRFGIVAAANYFDGLMDDIRIYDHALSLEEAAWLAGRTMPIHKAF